MVWELIIGEKCPEREHSCLCESTCEHQRKKKKQKKAPRSFATVSFGAFGFRNTSGLNRELSSLSELFSTDEVSDHLFSQHNFFFFLT